MTTGKSVVLMSGGIDSSATALAILTEGYETSGLFVDYGQPAARSEWRAARDVTNRFGIEIERIDLGFRLAAESGEFFGRNALLILTAAGTIETRPLTIALGIHALSEYYDTQPLFLRQMQRILDGYSGGSVSLSAPFLAYPKAEVIAFARGNGVPLEMTYSCETQNAPPCLRCPSCEDRIGVDAG
jgi:7-cyano-7-deazaguanine synthase